MSCWRVSFDMVSVQLPGLSFLNGGGLWCLVVGCGIGVGIGWVRPDLGLASRLGRKLFWLVTLTSGFGPEVVSILWDRIVSVVTGLEIRYVSLFFVSLKSVVSLLMEDCNCYISLESSAWLLPTRNSRVVACALALCGSANSELDGGKFEEFHLWPCCRVSLVQ